MVSISSIINKIFAYKKYGRTGAPRRSGLLVVSLFVYAIVFATIAVYGLGTATESQAAVTKFIQFQGKLTNNNASATNVANGTYSFEFKLYNVASSGSPVWTETWDGSSGSCPQLTVTNGVFNVKLGNCNALPDFSTNANWYLSVNFNPGAGYDGEMSPRKQIGASVFALVANGVNGDGNVTTTGNISTTGSGTVTSAGLLTGSAGLTVSGGTVNLTSTGASTYTVPSNTNNAFRLTDGTNPYLTVDTRTSNSGSTGLLFANAAPSIASSATSAYIAASFTPGTYTFTGTTNTTSTGASAPLGVLFNQPTIAGNGTRSITETSNVVIKGPTIASSSSGTETITTAYGLNILAGSALNGTGGAVTTGVGLSVNAPTGASSNYAALFNGGSVGIGNSAPASLFSVGSSSQFQVNSSGAIAAAAGIVSSGTIQFSSLTTNGALYTSGGNGTLTTTAPTSGAIGYWSRSSTTLTPTTANDIVSIPTTNTTGADLGVTNTGVYTGTGIINLTANSATTGTLLALSGNALSTGHGIAISSSGTITTTGDLLSLTANSATTSTGLLRYSATGLTTGFLQASTLGSALTTGGALNITGAVYAHGAAETGNLANLSFASAATITGSIATNGINVAATEQTSANTASLTPITSGINVATTVNVTGGASSTGTKTVNAINVASPTLTACSGGTNACIWNGVQITAPATTANITSTALKVTANSLTTDTAVSVSGTGLTSGTALSLTGGGANITSSGKVLDIAMGAATAGVGLNITTTGSYAGTGVATITANSLTTGTLLTLASSGTSQNTSKFIDIQQTGVTNLFASSILNISTSATTGASTFINLNANSATIATGESISMSALTTGTGLKVTGGSSMAAGGKLLSLDLGSATAGNGAVIATTGAYTGTGLETITANSVTSGTLFSIASSGGSQSTAKYIDLQQTGVTTGFTGNLINLASSSTTGAASFMNLTANSSTTGTGLAMSMTALTTGRGQTVTLGSALTTGGLLSTTGASYLHTGAETGSLVSLAYTDASSNSAGAAVTNGVLLSPTIATTASAGSKTINGISISPTFTSCGTTAGTCAYNGITQTTPAVTQSTTNALTINALNLSTAGALVQNTAAGSITWIGENIQMPNITQTTGTVASTGIKVTGGTVTSGTSYAFTSDTNAGNFGIGDTSPAALLTVGNGDLFQVNSSGAIAAATGITSSGTIRFSSLSGNSEVYTDGSSNLTSTPPTSGVLGYWSRTSTVLSPANANDTVSVTNSLAYTGTGLITASSNTLTSGTLLSLTSNGTGASTGQTGLNISLQGTNSTGSQTSYGAQISNTHAGTGAVDVGLSVTASGGASNYAIIVPNASGNVGIGTSTPAYLLTVAPTDSTTNVATSTLKVAGTYSGADNTTASLNSVDASPTISSALTGSVTSGTYTGLNTGITFNGSTSNNSQFLQITGVNASPVFSGTVGGSTDSISIIGVSTGSTSNLGTTAFTEKYGTLSTVSGTARNNYGVYAAATGGTNNYGVYINGPSSGAANYALYSAATAQSYFAGSVGIGTVSPLTTYNTNLTVSNTTSGAAGGIEVQGNAASTNGVFGGYEFYNSSNRQIAIQGFNDGGTTTSGLNIYTSNGGTVNTLAVTVKGDGRVGIGIASPTSGTKLEVAGNIGLKAGADAYVQTTDANNLILRGDQQTGTTGKGVKLQYWNGGSWTDGLSLANNTAGTSNLLLMSGGGNVGIGTTAPDSALFVNGSSVIEGSQYINGIELADGLKQFISTFDGATIDTTNTWVNSGNGGVSQSDHLIFASGTSAWNQGLISQATYTRSAGLILEADVTPTSSPALMIGFHNNDTTNFSYVDGNSYLYFNGGSFYVYENGSSVAGPTGTITNGTTYRIRVQLNAKGASYYYSTNGGKTWTTIAANVGTVTTSPVRVSMAYATGGANVDNMTVYSAVQNPQITGNLTVVGAVNQGNGFAQFSDTFDGTTFNTNTWTATGTITQNNNLSATGSGSWNLTGITSTQAYPRSKSLTLTGDVTPATSGHVMFGFSSSTTMDYANMPHAVYFASGGSTQIYENGSQVNVPSFTWTGGTTYRVKIAVNSTGAVYYISTDAGDTWTKLYDGTANNVTNSPLYIRWVVHTGTQSLDNVSVDNGNDALAVSKFVSKNLTIGAGNLYVNSGRIDVTGTAANSTLSTFTQSVANNSITLQSTVGGGSNYQPGIAWYTSDNNATKPKAGIWTQDSNSGSYLYFGTSNSYGTGITNQALTIDYNGNVAVGPTSGLTSKFEVDNSDNSNYNTYLLNSGGSGKVLRLNGGAGGGNTLLSVEAGGTPVVQVNSPGASAGVLSVVTADNTNFAAVITNSPAGNGRGLKVVSGSGSAGIPIIEAYKSGPTAVFGVYADGNVGIGTTNPTSYGSDGQLVVQAPASASNGIYLGADLAQQSAIKFYDGTNGLDGLLYRPAGTRDLALGFVSGSSVGINKTSGNIVFTQNIANSRSLTLQDSGVYSPSALQLKAGNSSGFYFNDLITTAASLVVSDGGNLTISGSGTTALTASRDSTKTLFALGNSSGTLEVRGASSQSANLMEWQNSGGTPLSVVDANGQVGIGTSTPSQKLQIQNGSALVNTSSSFTPTTMSGGFDAGAFDVKAVVVSGKYMYVGKAGSDTSTCSGTTVTGCELAIFDISNPNSITAVGGYNLPDGVDAIAAAGNYLYVGTNTDNGLNGELRIFDITNPASPNLIYSYNYNRNLNALYAKGPWLYAGFSATNDSNGEIYIFSISNPINVQAYAAIDTGGTGSGAGGVLSLYVQGNYLYVGLSAISGTCTGTGGTATGCEFRIYDITNISSVTYKSGVDTTVDVNAVKVSGKYAYLGLASVSGNDFRVYNVGDPTVAPTSAGGLDLSTGVNALQVNGKYAYAGLVSASGNDLRIFDISDPTSPTNVGGVDTGVDVKALDVSGSYIYAGQAQGTGNDVRIYTNASVDTQGLTAGSANIGQLLVNDNANVFNNLNVGSALQVGQGGIQSQGKVTIRGNATSDNILEVGSTATPQLFTVNPSGATVNTSTYLIADGRNEIDVTPSNVLLGDTQCDGNCTTLEVNDNSQLMYFNAGSQVLRVDAVNHQTTIGDVNCVWDCSYAVFDDNVPEFQFYGGTVVANSGLTVFQGDLNMDNGGNLTLNTFLGSTGNAGPIITIGRNGAFHGGAGSVDFQSKSGTDGYVWQDSAGNLRINTAAPTFANDVAGTVIGTQTSTRDTKQDIADYTDISGALQMIASAPLHTFRYKKDVAGYGDDSPLAKTRIGFIADEVPGQFMWGNAIDQVSVNGLLMGAVQELNKITVQYNANGNVGIGLPTGQTPSEKLVVNGNEIVSGTVTAHEFVTDGNADVAENYVTSDATLQAGELVAIDSTASSTIKRAGAGSNVMGVISSAPGLTLGGGAKADKTITKVPVALAGRVPVKVSNENGTIKPGDFLTLSATKPGYAMLATKAGEVIGQALEKFDGTGTTDTIMGFVQPTSYNGADIANEMPGLTFTYTDLSQATQNSYDILAHLMQQLPQLNSKNLSQVHTDVVVANGEVVTPTVTTHTLHADQITAATAQGGLSIASATVFNGGLKVDAIGSIGTLLSIQSDVEFFGIPYFTADTAGFALIKTGAQSVDVTFTHEYVAQPIINATISFEQTADPSLIVDPNAADQLKNAAITDTQAFLQAGISYAITNKSTTGFTIVLNKPAPNDIKFSWISLAVRNATTFTSKDVAPQASNAPIVPVASADTTTDTTSTDTSTTSTDSNTSTDTNSGSGQ